MLNHYNFVLLWSANFHYIIHICTQQICNGNNFGVCSSYKVQELIACVYTILSLRATENVESFTTWTKESSVDFWRGAVEVGGYTICVPFMRCCFVVSPASQTRATQDCCQHLVSWFTPYAPWCLRNSRNMEGYRLACETNKSLARMQQVVHAQNEWIIICPP